MFGSSLAVRRRVPELMDDPALCPALHEQALAGLAAIHRASGSARALWRPLHELIRTSGVRSLTLLDVAAGGGNLPLALQRRARRAGVELEVTAVDKSPLALAWAAAGAGAGGQPRRTAAGGSLRTLVLDALVEPLPGAFDVVTCSLFLHHLEEEEAASLMARMASAARRLLLVLDLARRPAGLLLAWAAPRLLCRSPVVHADAVLSVRAAFTPQEARALASRAGLQGARVDPSWPCRWLLRWSHP